jgi:glycosyltransferase involved in cell wall biosynthesis
MDPELYVDLRCLQDPKYRVRGIGQHVAALLRARARGIASNWRTIGLTDPRSPKLPNDFSSLVDEISSSVNPCCNNMPAVFIDGTPMTHDTRFTIRFVGNPAFLSAAVVYDFIPLDWPGYLNTVPSRIDYLAKTARLRNFDVFLPISEYTAWRLSELFGVSRGRIRVTGASVRRSLYELRDRIGVLPYYAANEPYFVVVVAMDPRKNPEVAIKAVRRLNLLYSRRIPLKVVGHFGDDYKNLLLQLAGHAEGTGFLEFCPDVSDDELIKIYAGAAATIAPSHIEGFSLPIVEAALCGCPVIASTCAAQLELIEQPEALFRSDDADALSEKLEALLAQPSLRVSLVSAQAHLSAKFHEDVVGERFWGGIEAAFAERRNAASILKRTKPRLAFLSPYPPDESDAAFYTAMTMEAGRRLFDSDVYTDTARPLVFQENFYNAGKVSLAPLLDSRYVGVISVLGSSSSRATFEFFERYGGPCILHDVRLTETYLSRLGTEEFRRFAATLLNRFISMEEVNSWVRDPEMSPLFLEPIIERASPLIVQTRTQQTLLKKHYGVDAHITTCCPTLFFTAEQTARLSRQAARERLGIPPAAFAVSSFGKPSREKGKDKSILAIEFLREWNIPADLYFVGNAADELAEIRHVSTIYGVAEHVHCVAEFEDPAVRGDFFIASDAAIQLRKYDFGKPSTILSNCISAGLPCVATDDMVISCDAPSYASCVPDHCSPLHVAEQLALIWESKSDRTIYEKERTAYISTHNFEIYSSRLMEILGAA